MLFSWDEWPGGTNIASTPAVWDEMFSIVPSERLGLNLDPSHLVWLQIDYERVVRDYASRIVHVHAKDMEIDRDGLYRNGTISLGMGWQVPRLPGLGEVRWDRFIAALYRAGYDYVVSIEHEDRSFEGTQDLVERGFLIARDVLRPHLQCAWGNPWFPHGPPPPPQRRGRPAAGLPAGKAGLRPQSRIHWSSPADPPTSARGQEELAAVSETDVSRCLARGHGRSGQAAAATSGASSGASSAARSARACSSPTSSARREPAP
jgi:hypothetical protein